MRVQHPKAEMLDTLRKLLEDAIRMRRAGATSPQLARTHGYVDGFMRALLEAGLADQSELLGVVNEVRERTDGPATAQLTPEAAA